MVFLVAAVEAVEAEAGRAQDYDMKQLDSSALPTKPPISRARPLIVVLSIFAAILIGFLAVVYAEQAGSVIIYGSLAVILVGIYRYTNYIVLQRRVLSDKLLLFATMNDFTYRPYQLRDASLSTLLRLYKKTGKAQHYIQGTWNELPFTLFTFQYAFNHQKRNSQAYDQSVMVAELTLPRSLPHIVIDARLPDQSGGMSALPIVFRASQRIMLEGVFYKHFSVYAADKDRITALSILSPDVMETLLEYAPSADMEIIENKLFFYWKDYELVAKDIENVFATISAITTELQRSLKHAKPESVGKPARLSASVDTSRLQHKMFMSGPLIVLVPLAGVLLALFATWLSPSLRWPSLAALMLALITYAFFADRRTKILRRERAQHTAQKHEHSGRMGV